MFNEYLQVKVVNEDKKRIVYYDDLIMFKIDVKYGNSIYLRFHDGFAVTYNYQRIEYSRYNPEEDIYDEIVIYSNEA